MDHRKRCPRWVLEPRLAPRPSTAALRDPSGVPLGSRGRQDARTHSCGVGKAGKRPAGRGCSGETRDPGGCESLLREKQQSYKLGLGAGASARSPGSRGTTTAWESVGRGRSQVPAGAAKTEGRRGEGRAARRAGDPPPPTCVGRSAWLSPPPLRFQVSGPPPTSASSSPGTPPTPSINPPPHTTPPISPLPAPSTPTRAAGPEAITGGPGAGRCRPPSALPLSLLAQRPCWGARWPAPPPPPPPQPPQPPPPRPPGWAPWALP